MPFLPSGKEFAQVAVRLYHAREFGRQKSTQLRNCIHTGAKKRLKIDLKPLILHIEELEDSLGRTWERMTVGEGNLVMPHSCHTLWASHCGKRPRVLCCGTLYRWVVALATKWGETSAGECALPLNWALRPHSWRLGLPANTTARNVTLHRILLILFPYLSVMS